MSIEEKIDIIGDSLSDIKGAIIAKGVTPSGNITTYATAIGEIGGGATLSSLTVTPSTTAQTITPASGTDGYGTVSVSAVTAAIDSDIVAGNIKSGVEILGVTGNYSGTTPTGTLSITANGVYDVTNYASADVSVSGGEISDGSALPRGNHSYTWQAVSGGDTYTISFVKTAGGTLPRATVTGNTITIYGNDEKNEPDPGGKK